MVRFTISDAPHKVAQQFKFVNILCFLNDPRNKDKEFSYMELSRIFNLSDTTIGRFLKQEYENHKKIFEFVKKSNICEEKDINKRFEIFMLDYILPNLSLHTIKKNKFFNDYYKLGVQKGKFKYQSLHTKNHERDLRKIKKELEEIAKKRKDNEEKIEKKIYKPRKKVTIIATTKSSETIKQLAKDFGCEIKEISERFDKHSELVFSPFHGTRYY
jgi:hypothetical protein